MKRRKRSRNKAREGLERQMLPSLPYLYSIFSSLHPSLSPLVSSRLVSSLLFSSHSFLPIGDGSNGRLIDVLVEHQKLRFEYDTAHVMVIYLILTLSSLSFVVIRVSLLECLVREEYNSLLSQHPRMVHHLSSSLLLTPLLSL